MCTRPRSRLLRLVPAAVICLLALPAPAPVSAVHPPDEGEDGPTIVVQMSDCKASRPGRFGQSDDEDDKSEAKKPSLFDFNPPKPIALIKKGDVLVKGESFTLYLPRAKRYRIKNTGDSDAHHDNTATRISIDANRDQKHTHDEEWFANLPIRIGDEMFDVTDIAKGGASVTLRASRAPLSGVVLGRPCPPFEFKATDGRTYTLETFKGRAFLLDIWSVT